MLLVFLSVSKLFRELFEIAHDKQPYEKIVITLDSVDPIIFEKLIEYMYEGKTMVNGQQKGELINLCKSLQLDVHLQTLEPLSQLVTENISTISEIVTEPHSISIRRSADISNRELHPVWRAQYDSLPLPVKEEHSMNDISFGDHFEPNNKKDVSGVDPEISHVNKGPDKRIIASRSIASTDNCSNSDKNNSIPINETFANQSQVMPLKDLRVSIKRMSDVVFLFHHKVLQK
jgi:hypothetical protein